jgi:sucrose phosphorylase
LPIVDLSLFSRDRATTEGWSGSDGDSTEDDPIVSDTAEFRQRALEKLTQLYGDDAPACLERLAAVCQRHRRPPPDQTGELWTERDAVLITYADQIRQAEKPPLQALNSFFNDYAMKELINTVHLLPFFPYSSDDGFSVIDYRRVDPASGNWDDVAELGASYGLMFDLVLNHCSKESKWFQNYLAGNSPYDRYFIDVDPQADLSHVTRPRSAPLLTPFETSRGTKHVWTTFSDDQVDLNFADPAVLVEMIDVLLTFVDRGARIIRLDAIAYLWKKIGSSCIHLPETHTLVKLLRDVLDEVARGTILLTETNVPHEENVSYFGNGDEAHMVYTFSLAPLLLDAFLCEDAGPLNAWLAELEPASPGTTYFNFTASHDGVGVRPMEGLVAAERIDRLISAVRARGGHVSTKRNADGSASPYELNITYFSALGPPDDAPEDLPPELHVRRFLSSQAVMLALRGIPGIYFHSLVGTPNDSAGVERSGRARSINRRKFDRDELARLLSDAASPAKQVFDGYRYLLAARRRQSAFHPSAAQSFIDTGHSAVIAFQRTSRDGNQQILAVTNVSAHPLELDLSRYTGASTGVDLLGGPATENGHVRLRRYGTAWINLQ